MINRIIKKAISITMTACFVVTSGITTNTFYSGKALAAEITNTGNTENSTAGSATDTTISDNLIKRVQTSNNDGVARFTYEDAEGNVCELDSGTTENKITTNSLKKSSEIPETYDLRDDSLVTGIKDQGVTGCCWAFAAIKTIESNCIKNGLVSVNSVDFSENHLAWFSYSKSTDSTDPLCGDGISVSTSSFSPRFDSTNQRPGPSSTSSSTDSTAAYMDGGSAILATFTLAKWSGAENETNAAFTASTETEMKSMASTMSSSESLRYDSYAHLQNAICYDDATDDVIKQEIIDNGAIDIAMYYNNSNIKTTTTGGTSYYQNTYSGDTAVSAANHCVTIVGWDDNYSKSNFVNTPSKDGAWLIANSYGTSSGDSGYFWLSYYDESICDVYSFDMESTDNYDNVYQYDGFGWGSGYGSDKEDVKAANVFTADSSSAQNISAVSFYTLTDGQAYTIDIYREVSGSLPESGVRISSAQVSGTEAYSGYHTVNLKSDVNIAAGEKFAIVITYDQTGSTYCYAPVEGETTSYTSSSDIVTYNYSSQSRQSYLYLEGKWYDTNEEGINNVCVKAFTDDIATAAAISAEDIAASTASATSTPQSTATTSTNNTGTNDVYTTSTSPSVSSSAPSSTSESTSTTGTNVSVKTGSKYTASGLIYKITSIKISKTNGKSSISIKAKVVGTTLKTTTITVPSTVKIKSYSCKVTSVGTKAFSSDKKLKKLIIGKNISSLSTKALSGINKLSKIYINTVKIGSVGSNAFKTKTKITAYLPSSKYKSYKKIIRSKGGKYVVCKKK